MPQLSPEALLYGLLIVAFLIFNYGMRQVAKRARESQQQDEAPVPAPVQARVEPADEEYAWGRKPVPAPAVELPPRHVWEPPPEVPALEVKPAATLEPRALELPEPVQVPSPRSRSASRPLFSSRKDLRRAIVVMTVLGPCRALDPPEQR